MQLDGTDAAHTAHDGTAYLFTDVEGSTSRWDRAAAEMSALMRRHDELCRSVIDRHRGHVFSVAGDSFGVAFDTADDALVAAVELQRSLTAEQLLPVRMGVHAGMSEQRDGNYFGSAVNRAARVAAAAHGGQIVVSSSVQRRIDPHRHGIDLRRLGVFRLKDLSREEEIWQVVGDGLPDGFPALRTLDVVRHNLPTQRTTLIGRVAVSGEVNRSIDDHPLTTLLGPGGMGKTRLALSVAASRVDRHPDGVWLVDLAPSRDAADVAAALSMAVRHLGAASDEDLVESLARQATLLIMDNCEHVVDAAADVVSRLLDVGGPLRVLATSQLPLRVPGERMVRLPPLGADIDDDGQGGSDGLRLFEDRARLVDPDFRLDERSTSTVATICRRLDGLPLAIEMAAANVEMMPPDEIAARLEDRFSVLVHATRSTARHGTLLAAIDWSVNLLDRDAQVLLDRLGVFAGPFTLAAAEVVCSDDSLPATRVLPLLTELVRRSLVSRVDIGAADRGFRLLESVRAFSLERLASRDEDRARTRAMTAWCADWATELRTWHVPPTARTYEAIRANLDNLSVAVQTALADRDAETAHRVVLGVASSLAFLNLRLGVRWLQEIERLAEDTGFDDPYWARRRVLATAQFEQLQGRFTELFLRLQPLCEESPVDDVVLAARHLSATTSGPAMPESARATAEEVRDAYLAIGDRHGVIEAEVTLSALELYEAVPTFTLAHEADFGIDDTMHGHFQWLCALLLDRQHERLLARLDEMDQRQFTFMLDHQADLLRAAALAVAGRFDESIDTMYRVLRVVRRDNIPLCAEEVVETLAFIAVERGDLAHATVLLGAFRSSGQSPFRTPLAIGMYRSLRAHLEAALDADEFRARWADGRALGVEAALRRELPDRKEPT